MAEEPFTCALFWRTVSHVPRPRRIVAVPPPLIAPV
jgi:hypothetical protein